MVPIAVVAGDPVRRGDDIDAALEQLAEQVDVGPDAVEVDDVRFGLEHVGHIAGSRHPERSHADDLAGVTAHLVGRVAVETDQFEVGVLDDSPHHFGAHIAGGELKDSESVIGQGVSSLQAEFSLTGHSSGRVVVGIIASVSMRHPIQRWILQSLELPGQLDFPPAVEQHARIRLERIIGESRTFLMRE